MNTIHNNGDNDQPLNDGLEQLGQAYGTLEQDEPPELVDQAILNSAQRAVEKKSGWTQFGWLHGLTTAAVFVMAFTIIVNQRETAPTYPENILSNKPERMESADDFKGQTKEKLNELKSEQRSRNDLHQAIPEDPRRSVASPASQLTELLSGDQNEQAMKKAEPALRARHSTLGKSTAEDKDDLEMESLREEVFLDEAQVVDAMADAPTENAASRSVARKQIVPATVAESEISAMESSFNTDSTIEQELLVIIELKKSGDETWITKLEAFVERYPDYPLPDDLKH